jgi:hypothetical protein
MHRDLRGGAIDLTQIVGGMPSMSGRNLYGTTSVDRTLGRFDYS